ncbi:MAG: DUF3382 domain-containing protein [Proteobacteria bacterium]|nr:DUF3382 domain-containing protein [Pseudomonadota bacterium]
MLKRSSMKIFIAIKNALISSLFALLLFGPILCFVLQGYQLDIISWRAWWILGLVFAGQFCLDILKENAPLIHLVKDINKQFKQKARIEKFKTIPHRFVWVFVCLTLLIIPFLISKYWLSVAILCLIYILLGLGLNIVVGLAGLLNLGFVAFYAIGAYSYALGAQYFHLGFWSALPCGAILAALLGALLAFPVLRMVGDYLAIVTLGFGEIVRLVLNNWSSLTGGPNGVEVPAPSFFNIPIDTSHRYLFIYIVLFFIVTLTVHFISRLQRMPLGRAFEALREDEIACRSLGINHVTTKLWAFSLSAMIGGIAGVFFATLEGFVSPSSFTFAESALILSIVVLGGMGSTIGVILAALVLTLLPEFLREFSEYRMLVFGGLMVAMMLWRPQGLIKFSRFAFEKPT